MKLMVLTCAVFPSAGEALKKMWIFMASCEKFGIQPDFYGVGTSGFPGYIAMKLDMQLTYLKQHRDDATHVLYTDGWDAFFVAPLEYILLRYKTYGSPEMLSAAYHGLANVSDPDKDYPNVFNNQRIYRYPHVGGYIAEIPYIIDMFERMLKLPRRTGDDCFSWYDAWQEGWFRPQLDHNCEIFQVGDEHCGLQNGRLWNGMTDSFPCILHLSGGYTDPETGKDERMLPWARALEIV